MQAYTSGFFKIKLPTFLGFFGGSRFVLIICAVASIFLGAAMYFIWPYFQAIIPAIGGLVDKTRDIWTLIYGFVLRMLEPFGLHHIFYLPFWTTALGGTAIINGQLIEGT